jgi:hypothetical protein
MIRTLATLCLALLVPVTAASAQRTAAAPAAPAPAPNPAMQAELRIERRMLTLDLVSYTESRQQQRRARQRLDEVLGRLDGALNGASVALGTLEGLQGELDSAREATRVVEDRLSAQLGRMQERLRRIALIEGEAGGRNQPADALGGRWRITIYPQNLSAVFDLRVNGTVVSGAYQVAGSTGGSFRGTFAGGRLHMERIDAKGGFDSTWDGIVADGRIVGTWNSNELVTGAPVRGDWTAVRESEP